MFAHENASHLTCCGRKAAQGQEMNSKLPNIRELGLLLPEGKKSQSFFCTFLHGWSGNSVVDCDWLRSRNLLHSICSLLAKLDKKTLMDSLKSLVINRYEPKNARLGLK